MTASCGPRKARPCSPASSFSSRCFVGILLNAPMFLIPIFSVLDACDEPPRFQGMKPQDELKPSYSPGDTVRYECRPGYQSLSPGSLISTVCWENNTWSPLQESCKKKSCPNLGDPENGNINYVNGSTEFGSQVHYVCNAGYYLAGPAIRYCQANDNSVYWSDSSPICEKIFCQPPGKILNGKYTNSHKEVFEYNEVVTYSCDPSNGPDEYSLVGNSTLVCVGNDKWNSEPPECKVVKCEYPVLQDGEIISGFGTKFYYKAKVIFKCKEGFTLIGSNTVFCNANSTWEPPIPKCVKESTTPSTQSPISSVSVSTQPPIPSVPGSKPTSPTVSPGSSHPGHPRPTDESAPEDNKHLGVGPIIGIFVAVSVVLGGIVGACIYKCLSKNKSAYLTDESHREVNRISPREEEMKERFAFIKKKENRD
ncbi:membrane cofactor protein isoform X1 [Camelus dromedarius]|uniref:membrane cofactor protein isoform X1 n=2 Tax=Camelus dromedarius TaxID=9838 RepID=UPI001263A09E|nr:membrane cofactor protein isoform X2 [Camelus dromedarius]